ncbi:hypothetical protein HNQ82_001162 [Anoxybacillus tengchongensis]|uniref:Uncharacterized protein n=1 Tax=Anoxybacillus tengchongensis TaxID=576944 RepID=A0A7W9YQ92_9BACL|nr:hypothetical protein [Anoxybacillus tengchongensis]
MSSFSIFLCRILLTYVEKNSEHTKEGDGKDGTYRIVI